MIDLASSGPTEGTVAPAQLTFTGGPSGNCATAQTITATGIDDAVADGDQAYTVIVTTNAAATADPAYDAIDPDDVSATNTDDPSEGAVEVPTLGEWGLAVLALGLATLGLFWLKKIG